MQQQRIDPWPDLVTRLGLTLVAAVPTKRAGSGKSANQPVPGRLAPKSDGERTDHLLRLAGELFAANWDLQSVEDVCLAWNSKNPAPLDELKVRNTCASIEKSDRTNHPERARLRDELAAVKEPLFDPVTAKASRFAGSKPPPRRWLLTDFLPAGIVCSVVSPGGVGKSQLLMQLAYTIATGLPLADYWACDEIGSALMLCAEDDEAELHRRFSRIDEELTSGASPTTSPAGNNLFIRTTFGENTLMTRRTTGRHGELERTTWVSRLIVTANSIPNLKLIVLDPASRFRGGEENSNEDGTRFVEALEQVAKETGATVLIAHHANKASITGGEKANQANARGASSLTDGVRWQLALTTVNDRHPQHARLQSVEDGHYLEALLVKSNYTPPQSAVYLRRGHLGYLSVVQHQTALKAPDDDLQQLLHFISAKQPPVSARQLETFFSGAGKPLQLPQHRTRALVQSARNAGLLEGTGRQPLKLTTTGHSKLRGSSPDLPSAATRHGAASSATSKKVKKIK